MLPASSRRSALAATSNPSKSSPSEFASSRHCSLLSTPPSSDSSTCSRAVRQAVLNRGAISGHSRCGKLSSSEYVKARLILTSSISETSPWQRDELTHQHGHFPVDRKNRV